MISYYPIFFRSLFTLFISFFISLFLFKKIIIWNKNKNNITENIRKLGIKGENKKIGIPTMGGIIFVISIITSTILFSSINNFYILILIIITIYIGIIGFIDDYIKINYNKKGISPIIKIISQIIIGIFLGISIYFNTTNNELKKFNSNYYLFYNKGINTNIPKFLLKIIKKKEFNYSFFFLWSKKNKYNYTYITFIIIVIITMIFLSNGSNITDGIDGLTCGSSLIIMFNFLIFSIISSDKYYSNKFNFIYIPYIKETIIFICSTIGTLLSFLWYNIYPAKIFMGDTGSLTIGGIISALFFINKVECTIPILCGIFFIENISVIIQLLYFIYTKKKYGLKKKFFLMAPIHHHFQKLGYHENTICIRFIIIQIILSILSFILLIS
ncbi:MraY family glycosyltransferase [Blattabacterium cuenoti]|uniref:phospho-N-acetylmuramoyl-pentapeptide- transferase n=1 Tax=Blattabacterium cuenoti TaxID=1653831 RepID=UPI00163B816A|nr:phospho-N-acetylmuramoyl-pentapeptide-transferase [Blattabacterium cuenoti]